MTGIFWRRPAAIAAVSQPAPRVSSRALRILRPAHRRRLTAAYLAALIESLASAMMAATVVLLANAFANLDLPPLPLASAAAALTAAVHAWRIWPIGWLETARQVDRHFGLQERLASLSEIEVPTNPVERLLVQDVERRINPSIVANAISLRPTRRTLGFFLVSIASLAAVSTALRGGWIDSPESLLPPDQALVAERLSELAAALRVDERYRNDSFAAALIRDLERAAADLAAGVDPLTARERDLPSLINQVASLPDVGREVQALAASIFEPASPVASDGPSTPPPATDAAGGGSEGQGAAERVNAAGPLENPASGEGAPGAEAGSSFIPAEDIHPELAPGMGPAPEGLEAAPGAPVGASTSASAGASSAAGEGSAALYGDPDSPPAPGEGVELESLALVGELDDDGRRIAIEIMPNARVGGASAGQPSAGQRWSPASEAFVAGSRLAANYHSTAARYFIPSQERLTTSQRGGD